MMSGSTSTANPGTSDEEYELVRVSLPWLTLATGIVEDNGRIRVEQRIVEVTEEKGRRIWKATRILSKGNRVRSLES